MTTEPARLPNGIPTPANLLEQEQRKAEATKLNGEVVIRLRYKDGKHVGTKVQPEANYPPPW